MCTAGCLLPLMALFAQGHVTFWRTVTYSCFILSAGHCRFKDEPISREGKGCRDRKKTGHLGQTEQRPTGSSTLDAQGVISGDSAHGAYEVAVTPHCSHTAHWTLFYVHT